MGIPANMNQFYDMDLLSVGVEHRNSDAEVLRDRL